jgi:hypothetical protein
MEYRGAFRNKEAPRDLLYAKRTEDESDEIQKIKKTGDKSGNVNEEDLLNDMINMKFGKEEQTGSSRNKKIVHGHRNKSKKLKRQLKF